VLCGVSLDSVMYGMPEAGSLDFTSRRETWNVRSRSWLRTMRFLNCQALWTDRLEHRFCGEGGRQRKLRFLRRRRQQIVEYPTHSSVDY
jgi:hypothetical protein